MTLSVSIKRHYTQYQNFVVMLIVVIPSVITLSVIELVCDEEKTFHNIDTRSQCYKPFFFFIADDEAK